MPLHFFENSKGEQEWKIVPGNDSANVRSDFEIAEDSENVDGLHVLLTFTFSAAGLLAPLYVTIEGLINA